jgi:hypothetical protein
MDRDSPASHCTAFIIPANLYSFRNDQCLVLSTQTAYRNIKDCFRIVESEGGNEVKLRPEIESKPSGLQTYAVTVSQVYFAVAFVDQDGNIPEGCSSLIGKLQIGVNGIQRLQNRPRKASRIRTPSDTDPITLSFSNHGKRLILLHHVSSPSRLVLMERTT